MTHVDRILTEHHVTALVAPDTFTLLAERVQRLMPAGRSFAVAHRYATYTGQAPEVYPHLTVTAVRATNGLWVACEPSFGFGFAVDERYGDRSEADVWKRYHAGRHEADAFSERRRFMTEVSITGGRERDESEHDDALVIRTYNADGVCDEKVVAFEQVTR